MPVLAQSPFHTYQEQLWPLSQGLALWKPNPGDLYDRVSIGDVGYVSEGAFIRMFNVRLPWDDESNRTFGIPDRYDPLGFGHPSLSIRRETFHAVDHYSRSVSRDQNPDNIQAASPDQADRVAYSCQGHGAILSLPHGGYCEEAVQVKIFEKYIQDNVVSWFTWAQRNQLGVERMEDLILVSGCTLVTTWAAAVFTDQTLGAEISLASRTLSNGAASFVCSNARGPVQVHHNCRFNSQNSPTTPDQCVFIKGFRAKRVLFRIKPLRAAAEPLPDDPDNRRDGDIHVAPVPGVSKHREPLNGVLDYIAEKCIEGAIDEDIIAIAHDDDLHFIEDMKTSTADEIEKYLHERNMPLLVESGAAILRVPHNNTSPVSHHFATSSAGHLSPLSSPTASSFAADPPLQLPETPPEQNRKRIFAHSSGLPGCHKQAPEGDPPADNEEHLGDQASALVVTDATQKRFPHLEVRPAFKALLIGISDSNGSDPGNHPSPLAGPLNDAKAMKTALIDLYHYREEDIFVMTDEEKNVSTELWPSKENILRAMDNLVKGATPGDTFVFYYVGHDGRDESERNDVVNNHTYILTCDDEKIPDYDIRKHLVDPLPRDCRLTAILDVCLSDMLLNLKHYDCHCIRRRSQSVSERKKKPLTPYNVGKRRHSDAALQPWAMRNNPHLRAAFNRAATVARVVVRLKSLVANKPRSARNAYGRPTPHSRCDGCFRIYELPSSPLVIFVSVFSFNGNTLKDSKRKGKGMTTELIKILRENPSIHVGDLDQQLRNRLSKLAFKRVREARTAFKTYSAKLPHETRIRLERKYASQGLFDFKAQTVQFGSLQPLCLNDQFILERNHTGDLFH